MKKSDNSVVKTVIISVVVLVVVLILIFTFKPTSVTNNVNVQGRAVVKAVPDLVTIYFNVEVKADTAVEAKENQEEEEIVKEGEIMELANPEDESESEEAPSEGNAHEIE